MFNKERYAKLAESEKFSDCLKLLDTLENEPNDSLTRYYYLKIASRFDNLDESVEYLEVSRKILSLSVVANDTIKIAKALKFIGNYHLDNFQNDSAYYYYSKSEKEFLKSKKKSSLAEIKLAKAKILYYEKDFAGSETATVDVIKEAKKNNNIRMIYECYLTLGNNLEGLNDSEKALDYYKKATFLSEKLQEDYQFTLLKAQPYNFIGGIYIKTKQFKKAIPYFEKGLQFDDFKSSEPLMYANLINNLAYSRLMLGDKNAITQLEEALQIRDSLKNTPGIVSSKIYLAEYYLLQKNIPKAIVYINQARNTSHINNMFEDELKTLALLVKIEPSKTKFYNDRLISLSDSLQTVVRATRNKFARIEFETNEIITEKNVVETQNEKLIKQIFWISGIGIFGLSVLGLLYWSKKQHAKNKELQFEQQQQKTNQEIYQLMLDQQTKLEEGRKLEKLRMSQELHDGIIGQLASIRMNTFALKFNNDKETIDKTLIELDKIKKIEVEIRVISHDLRKESFETKDSFWLMLTELFENHCQMSGSFYKLDLDKNINWEKLNSNIKMNLYRIFQESLHNIYKYADAKNISGTIKKIENNLDVEIKDNGNGFDSNKSKEGIGLKNIQSRVSSLDGKLNINSEKNAGTTIQIVIPITA